jgi:hypothetical protein
VDKLHAFGATKVKAGETAVTAKDTVADVAGAAKGKAYEAEDVASAKAGEAGSYVNECKSKAEDAAAETIQNVGKNWFNDIAGEDDDTRTRRLRLLQVVEGDDWNSVIDGQMNQTLDPRVSNGGALKEEDVVERNPVMETGASEQIVSSFALDS